MIADKSVDGWKVVDEYVSDDLASGSEEDKRLRRARETVGQKRRQAFQHRSDHLKRFRTTLSSSDQQLFRGKIWLMPWAAIFFVSVHCAWVRLRSSHTCALVCFMNVLMIYVRLNVVLRDEA